MPMKKPEIKSLYYITHIDNLHSILGHGILSHKLVEERSIPFTPVYNADIVSTRKQTTTPDGRSLWHYANLYFQPRNPMLYRVLYEKDENELAILGIQPGVLDTNDILISTGNAASGASDILPREEGLEALAQIWDTINSEWWNPVDGSKRKIMAECLVPGYVSADLVHTIYLANHKTAEKVKDMGLRRGMPVVPEPNMFFRPAKRCRISDNLTLAEGDMFFSTMQTLTISVNTVGIMGKGLASRAKYQFPDVYVWYQEACRRKWLQMGKPYLYKREQFVDMELADDSATLLGANAGANAKKWFLLFATKRHWREASGLAGIEAGLSWIQEHYKREGIQSLAIPALGCGLGRLDWRDVGPVMCRYLVALDIEVVIYLPREREIPDDLLSPTFLLPAK